VSVWIGCFKFSHTAVVRVDETLRQIFGWKRVPSGTTYGRFFQKFDYEKNTEVFTRLNRWFFNQLTFDNYTLDVDSTVLTRYGDQEGARKGYNPKKRGRNSHWRYHCLVTNQKLPAREIWEQYKRRADAENRIKELKEDFGAEGFNMDSFYATEAVIKMVCVSYNLMSLFRQVTHQNQARPRLPTLRFNCFAVGSWIVKKGNATVLKLSVPLKRRQWYDGLFDKIRNTVFPISLNFNSS
jgi:hypothetical protein